MKKIIKQKITEKPLNFDVIIVYNENVAFSANDKNYKGKSPFNEQKKYSGYNKSYIYFLEQCKKQGLNAAFAITSDVIGDGLVNSFWIYNKKWQRKKQSAQTLLIYDKFSHGKVSSKNITNLLAPLSGKVHLFHNKIIRELFDNKLNTYNTFSELAVPTTLINLQSKKKIATTKKHLLKILEHHKYKQDFNNNLVLKDQFGSEGTNVFKIRDTKKLLSIGKDFPLIHFLLQPLIKATGFKYGQKLCKSDLRIIICNGKIVQSFVRIAKKGDFRANAAQGGKVKYLDIKKLPLNVTTMFKAINKKLPIQNAFYALDFIKSSTGHLYFMEGNITPGLIWYDKKDEICAKQLIRLIVKNLKKLV